MATTITKDGLEAIGFIQVDNTENIYDKKLNKSIISVSLLSDNTVDVHAVDSNTMESANFAHCKTLEEVYHLSTTIEKYQG